MSQKPIDKNNNKKSQISKTNKTVGDVMSLNNKRSPFKKIT